MRGEGRVRTGDVLEVEVGQAGEVGSDMDSGSAVRHIGIGSV